VTQIVQVDRQEEVAVVRMRAGKANALGKDLLEALLVAFDEIDHATSIVLTGDGSAFSAGLALPELIDHDRPAMSAHIELFERVMRRVLTEPRATVAAINGHAYAGGCVLAMMCDASMMVAGEARIGLNEVQLGIGLPALVVEPLRHRVPASSLAAIALEGRVLAPDDALKLGLVDMVVPGSLEARAIEHARALGRSPLAYMQIKHALLRPALEAIDRHAASEREAWLDTWFSAHAQKLLRAAVERITKR
jgi:enoyl-CoA hydratase